jgi:hypothetical protein
MHSFYAETMKSEPQMLPVSTFNTRWYKPFLTLEKLDIEKENEA